MTKLSILILSDSENYANSRIKHEAEALGHKAVIMSPDSLIVNFDDNGKMNLYLNNNSLNGVKFNAVIPRLGTNRAYGTFILNCLIDHFGIVSTATASGINLAANKLFSAYQLSKFGIKQPATTTVRNPNDFDFLINSVGGLPAILKTFNGSKGNGVYLLYDKIQSSITLKNLRNADFQLLLQKFIKTAKKDETPSDIRCWVVGNKVVAAFKRFASKDDVRSNYSISKIGEKITLTQKEIDLAIKAAKVSGLDCCGVDIARNVDENNEPLVYEINSNADLKGIEAVTGFNVAKSIIQHVENKIKEQLLSNKQGEAVKQCNEVQQGEIMKSVSFEYIGEFASQLLGSKINQVGFRF